MRQVADLRLRQVRFVIRQFLQSWTYLIPQTVAKNQGRTNQVRALLRAFGQNSVAIDAELRVDLAAARGCGVVHFLALIGSRLAEHDRTG
jgi:hypothetical protein